MTYNNLFDRFRALSFSKEAIGLEWNGSEVRYFCTPVDSEVIGWLGVDGIHFCFIPLISSDMVFAVSPMPCGEHYVEPISRSFQEFLSLVLFCKGASPLEQICFMSEEQFFELLKSEEEHSWAARDTYLSGPEAVEAFNNIKKNECFAFYQHENKALKLTNSKNIKAEAFDNENDIYVVDNNMTWTYVHTHEYFCGPYFYKI